MEDARKVKNMLGELEKKGFPYQGEEALSKFFGNKEREELCEKNKKQNSEQ